MKRTGNHYWLDYEYERAMLISKLRAAGYVWPSELAERWMVSQRHARRLAKMLPASSVVFLHAFEDGDSFRLMVWHDTPAPRRRRRGNPAFRLREYQSFLRQRHMMATGDDTDDSGQTGRISMK